MIRVQVFSQYTIAGSMGKRNSSYNELVDFVKNSDHCVIEMNWPLRGPFNRKFIMEFNDHDELLLCKMAFSDHYSFVILNP